MANPHRSLEIPVAGGTLVFVVAAPLAPGLRRTMRQEAQRALAEIRHHPAFFVRLRQWPEAQRLIPGLAHCSDRETLTALELLVREGRLLAMFMPRTIKRPSHPGRDQAATTPPPPPRVPTPSAAPALSPVQAADAAVRAMPAGERMLTAWRRVLSLKLLGEEASRLLTQFIEHDLVPFLVGGAVVGATLAVFSELIVPIMLVTAFAMGFRIGMGVMRIIDATIEAASAKTDAELTRAARTIGATLEEIGAQAVLLALMMRMPVRSVREGSLKPPAAAAAEESAPPPASTPPPPKKVLEPKLERAAEDVLANKKAEVQSIVDTKSFATAKDKAVFYSGPGNRDKALALARSEGLEPIDLTEGGSALNEQNLYSKFNELYPEADKYWSEASEKYANGASGDIQALVEGAKADRVFATKELPILLKNPNVTTINGIERTALQQMEQQNPGSAFKALTGGH